MWISPQYSSDANNGNRRGNRPHPLTSTDLRWTLWLFGLALACVGCAVADAPSGNDTTTTMTTSGGVCGENDDTTSFRITVYSVTVPPEYMGMPWDLDGTQADIQVCVHDETPYFAWSCSEIFWDSETAQIDTSYEVTLGATDPDTGGSFDQRVWIQVGDVEGTYTYTDNQSVTETIGDVFVGVLADLREKADCGPIQPTGDDVFGEIISIEYEVEAL